MSVTSKDMAQPDNQVITDPTSQDLAGMADKWKPRETSDRDMASVALGQRRKLGGVRRAVAVGLAAGSILVGANLVLNGDHNKQAAAGGSSETSVPTLTPTEVKKDNLKVSEINPEKPPTDILNGTVTIKINTENDTPALSTTPGTIDDHNPENMKTFSEIKEVNGSSIAEAVDSNGKIELVLTDPLVTRNRDKTLAWITIISNGKPLYLQMGQENVDKVMVIQNGNEEIFKEIPKDALALDYGKVQFAPAP